MRKVIILISKRKFFIPILIIAYLLIMSSAILMIDVFSHRNILGGKVIVIDAGHGGVDGGANNSYILEKDINLDVALRLQKRLESSGARVIMTRTQDVELSKSKKIDRSRYREDLNTRLHIINNSSAHMFISIHANSNKSRPSTRGAMVYYYNSHPHNRVIAYIFQNVFNNYEFDYHGKKYKSYHIPQVGKYFLLAYAKIPGVIVETGFITNSTDLLFLKTPAYREYISDAIFQGIIGYLQSSHLPEKTDEITYTEEEHIFDMPEEDILQED